MFAAGQSTADILAEVSALRNQSEGFHARSTTATRKAATAERLGSESLHNASRMLNIMRDFASRATGMDLSSHFCMLDIVQRAIEPVFPVYRHTDENKDYLSIISKCICVCSSGISRISFGVTVEPLSNDHPHQRPSLLYDHILCDVVGAAQHI